MGLGYERERAGVGFPETIRIGDGAQRAYSSDDEKGGGKRDVSYGDVDCISATGARQSAEARSDEGGCGQAAGLSRDHGGELYRREGSAGGGGCDVGVKRENI